MKTRFSNRAIQIVAKHVNEMLTDTCGIKRKTLGSGPYAEPSWVQIAMDVPCRVIRSGQKDDVVVASAIITRTKYHVILAKTVDLKTSDRITLEDGDYEVLRDIDDLTDDYHRRVEVSLVKT